MGGDGDQWRIAAAFGSRDNIAGTVDFRVPLQLAKSGRYPLGALLFKESCGGDAAELEVLLLNPEAFAAEPFERGAHAGRRGKIGDGLGERGQVSV